ncbi:MAG: glutaredoxin domain-containing protein [Saprospiraceae bacterium]
MKDINSSIEFDELIGGEEKSFVLLYKGDSESCQCAIKNINNLNETSDKKYHVFVLDVTKVGGLHSKYGVTTDPTLLHFENNELKNVVKGCMTTDYYNSYFNEKYSVSAGKDGEIPQKRVVVYSTPSCPWCTKLKDYLKENKIKFEDVDVAANSGRAEEMKKKSGQMGVPQTDIGGQMIVGFDKVKINRLLNIN